MNAGYYLVGSQIARLQCATALKGNIFGRRFAIPACSCGAFSAETFAQSEPLISLKQWAWQEMHHRLCHARDHKHSRKVAESRFQEPPCVRSVD